MNRYLDDKAGKNQAQLSKSQELIKKQGQERKEKEKGGPSTVPSKGEKKSKNPSTLDPDAEKASNAFEEGCINSGAC